MLEDAKNGIPDGIALEHCASCDAPLVEHQGIYCTIDGRRMVFCSTRCVGDHHRREMVPVGG